MKEFFEIEFDSIEEQRNYIIKYRRWQHSDNSKKTIKIFNPNKKEKKVRRNMQ